MEQSEEREQIVTVHLVARDSREVLGDLEIRGTIPRKFVHSLEIDNLVKDTQELEFSNVPLVQSPTAEFPIEYCPTNEMGAHAKLMLLEETKYHVVYKPLGRFSESEVISLLPTIKKESKKETLVFEKWSGIQEHGGTLHFHSYVGKSFFDIQVDGLRSVKVPFEVRSKKIGYLKQYPIMLSDLSQAAAGILFESGSPLFQTYDFGDQTRKTFIEDVMFLTYLFLPDNLPLAYEHVRRNLYSRLESRTEEVPTSLAESIDPSDIIDMISEPKNLSKTTSPPQGWPTTMKGYVPTVVQQKTNYETIDTPENRLVKDLLLSIEKLITSLKASFSADDDDSSFDRLIIYDGLLQEYLSDKWLDEVGGLQFVPSNSQVLQKREGYRNLFHFYLNFAFAFRMEWKEMQENVRGYNRKMSELYEYWCYFKLVKVLDDLSIDSLDFNDLFEVNKGIRSIRVKRGNKSIHSFDLVGKRRPVTIRLMYNKLFSRHTKSPSYSLPFKPDYSLHVIIDKNDKKEDYFIHFDAKYRSEVDVLQYYEKVGGKNPLKSQNDSEEDDETVKEDGKLADDRDKEEITRKKFVDGDIYKMHTYKDAILLTKGAYVLYPGHETKVFYVKNGKDIPSVGAFPLTPERSGDGEECLKNFIDKVIDNLLD